MALGTDAECIRDLDLALVKVAIGFFFTEIGSSLKPNHYSQVMVV